MSKKFNSRALRQLAEQLIRQAAEEAEEAEEGEEAEEAEEGEEAEDPEAAQEDLVTSLVRQWITYDGNATLLMGEQQVYLVLSKTPRGRPRVIAQPGLGGWLNQLTRDWKLSPEQWPGIIEQLNRGQSVEVINGEGIPLRLWVNPQERSRGVEPQTERRMPPGTKRDYHKIAVSELEQLFGPDLAADEKDLLACSLAAQWQKYEGRACLFMEGQQFAFTVTDLGEGNCRVDARRRRMRLDPVLCSLGLPPEVVPEVIARINLNQEIEFRDRNGVRSRLWHDPKEKRIVVQAFKAVQPTVRGSSRPIFCPKCHAVLRLWRDDERQQLCPGCGHTVLPA